MSQTIATIVTAVFQDTIATIASRLGGMINDLVTLDREQSSLTILNY